MTALDYANVLRGDFVSFLHRAFIELNPGSKLLIAQYVELIASALEDCRRGITNRLIINLPPRYLKSHCASICFPAWLLGHDPTLQIICASYSQDLASKLALDTRKVLSTAWYQAIFATRLADDKRAVDDFMTSQGGGRMATSVGGTLTGRGGDFLIIDDPIKPDEALSDTQRKAAIEWWDGTLRSRLNNKKTGCIILIMQRLHQEDLVGHVLAQEDWRVVKFPAIAEQDESLEFPTYFGMDTYARKEGAVLQEERETEAMLRKTRELVGDYHFSSQYQQNPTPREGNIVKTAWITYYDDLPPRHECTAIIQSWDTASKAGELNDFSVCSTWHVKGEKYYLADIFRKRLNYPDLKKAAIEQWRRHSPSTVIVEEKASGVQLIQELKAEGAIKVEAYLPAHRHDKIMRLSNQSDLFEAGRVLLPRNVPWLAEYRQEITSFPGGKYDDQVDSTSQALDYMRQFLKSLEIWAKLAQD